ncbi:hypothetical protein [Streptomyces sp. MBT55]|nr:hypothetical protein [Streptomyces sp. MBT55]
MRLNPPKAERRVWNAEDQVGVVATDRPPPPSDIGEPQESATTGN